MRRAARILGWTAVAVAALGAVLAGVVLITPNTAAGRRLIERLTPQLTAGRVRISGLAGTFPGEIDVGALDLSDARGVWLSAKRVSLRWSPLDLLGWRVRIERLAVAELRIARPPQPPPREAHPVKSARRPAPPLPRIEVGNLSIDSLVLEPAVAGSRASLVVRGRADIVSPDEAAADVTARRTNGEGDYELHFSLTRSGLDATLQLEEPASGPLEHLAGLPGLGALAVVASVEGPRSAERVRVDARVGALAAKLSGNVDAVRRTADVSYSVESPAIAPRPGVAWRRLSLEGRSSGPLDAPQASGRLRVDGLELPGGLRLATLAANLGATGGVIELHATAGGLALPGPWPRLVADSPVELDAKLHLNERGRPLDIAVRHRLVSVSARALTEDTPSATFDIHIPDVAPFPPAAKLHLSGSLAARGSIAEDASSARIEITAASRLDGRGILARLLGGPARTDIAARITSDGLDVQRLGFEGAVVSLSGSGRASFPSGPGSAPTSGWRIGDAHWRIDVRSLAALHPAMHGTLALTAQASGPLSTLAARVRMVSSLSVRGSPPGTLDATLETRGLPPDLTGTLALNGSLDGAPLALDAAVVRGRGHLPRLTIRRAEWKSVHIDADVTSARHLAFASGKVDLSIGRLADLQPLLGRPLGGSMAGTATLATRNGRTFARLDVDARGVATAGLSADVRISGSGPVNALPLALDLDLADLGGHPASLEAAVRANVAGRRLRIEKLAAHYRGETLALLSPVRIALARGVSFGAVRLGMARAILEVAGRLTPALDLRASLKGVDAKLIDVYAPRLLESGTIGASARLTGTLAAPAGRVSVTVSGLKMADPSARYLAPIDAHGVARISGAEADIDARLEGGPESRIVMRGRVPINAAGRYDVKIAGRLEAALANPLLEAHGERAAGTLTVDAAVSGPAADPEIEGTVDIEHGDLRDYAEGLHLGDINARIVGGRGILSIASLSARAGPGTVSLTGTFGVLERNMPIDLRLVAKNAEPIESDLLTTNLDADVTVRGTLRERIDLAGRIRVNRARIGVPNGLPPNVAVLDVRRPGEAPPQPVAHRLKIGLDLALDAPRAILVQGRGLDAELGGTLAIGGTTQDPQVRGGFTMIMGTFSMASTQLAFSSGTVTFTGAGLRQRIDPTLDFVARTTAANATVTLRVSGFADAPRFDLSSTPSLPQDEILARLLFGESASQLSGLQVAEIGAALASLSGIAGGGALNPLARVQRALGLDRLTLGSATTTTTGGVTQSTGASITAGRYVSSRVFVSATQNTTGTSQLKVDIALTRHLKVQTRIGNGTATAQGTTPENDPGSSIGLSYEFDY